MKTTYNIYADPGHAWCKVSKKELVDLGITNLISTYSYQRGNYAYLEEDCDLTKFINAKGIELMFRETHTHKSSKIRNYDRYTQ